MSSEPRQRVVITGDGPHLVEGPVEIVLPDGSRTVSERPVTALCVCYRSTLYPICDTSHRRRRRPTRPETPEEPS